MPRDRDDRIPVFFFSMQRRQDRGAIWRCGNLSAQVADQMQTAWFRPNVSDRSTAAAKPNCDSRIRCHDKAIHLCARYSCSRSIWICFPQTIPSTLKFFKLCVVETENVFGHQQQTTWNVQRFLCGLLILDLQSARTLFDVRKPFQIKKTPSISIQGWNSNGPIYHAWGCPVWQCECW